MTSPFFLSRLSSCVLLHSPTKQHHCCVNLAIYDSEIWSSRRAKIDAGGLTLWSQTGSIRHPDPGGSPPRSRPFSVVLSKAKTGLLIILETLTGRGSSIFVIALFVWLHCHQALLTVKDPCISHGNVPEEDCIDLTKSSAIAR